LSIMLMMNQTMISEHEYMEKEKMTREQLIELVTRIVNCDGTEQEIDEMISVLTENVQDPEVTDYIYYDEKTPEEIVDKALSYTPIAL